MQTKNGVKEELSNTIYTIMEINMLGQQKKKKNPISYILIQYKRTMFPSLQLLY